MPKSFRCAFTIRSETRYLAALRRIVEAVSDGVGKGIMNRKAVNACRMALIEAVDNAIIHAHRRKKSLPIRIAIAAGPKQVVMDVVDMGSGIGHLNPPEPDTLSCRGRGLIVISKVMTRVISRAIGDRHMFRMIYRI
jgi:anti-sigma regulatory factor (Ser/Thr protein kinase)